MLEIIGLVVVLVVIGAAVYYFGFYKKGKINDRDGDFIPDEIEDAVEDVKETVKEVKRNPTPVLLPPAPAAITNCEPLAPSGQPIFPTVVPSLRKFNISPSDVRRLNPAT